MNIKRKAKIVSPHYRAFSMPTWAAATPRTFPREFSRLLSFPEDKIAWVFLILIYFDSGPSSKVTSLVVEKSPFDLAILSRSIVKKPL